MTQNFYKHCIAKTVLKRPTALWRVINTANQHYMQNLFFSSACYMFKLHLCECLSSPGRWKLQLLDTETYFFYVLWVQIKNNNSYYYNNNEAKGIWWGLHQMTPHTWHTAYITRSVPNQAVWHTDWLTDTVNISKNSQHVMHSMQPKNSITNQKVTLTYYITAHGCLINESFMTMCLITHKLALQSKAVNKFTI